MKRPSFSLPPPPGVFQIQQVGSGAPGVVRDPAFLVLADDPNTRRDGIRRLSRELDLSRGEEETLVEEITQEERARTRLSLLDRRRSESLYLRYRTLENDLRATRRFLFDLLEPPAVAAVLAHLRLSLGQDGSQIVEGLQIAGDNLVAEVGIEEAFHRLSGLPNPLPETLVKAIVHMEHEARRKLIRRVLRVPTSPIARIHGLRLLSALVSQDPALARLARRMTRRFGDNQWASEVEVFRQALLIALDRIEMRTNVGDFTPSALLAAWYHAHRVARAFLAAGADASKLSDLLVRTPGREWTAYFNPEKLGWLDIAHARHVNSLRLAFAGITYALENDNGEVLTADLVAQLTARFTVTKDKQCVPEMNLYFDTNRLENRIDSFLPLDTDDVGGFARTRVPVFAESPTKQQIVEDAIEGLEQDITNLGSWLTLNLVAGVARLDEELKLRALAAFRSMELATIVQAAGINAAIPVMQTCWVVGAGGTDSDRSKILGELRDVARVAADTRKSGTPVNQSGGKIDSALETALLEGALALARGEPTPESCVRTFASALSSFAAEDPAWWARIRPILESLVAGLKLDLAHWLTPLLLKARAASAEIFPEEVPSGDGS